MPHPTARRRATTSVLQRTSSTIATDFHDNRTTTRASSPDEAIIEKQKVEDFAQLRVPLLSLELKRTPTFTARFVPVGVEDGRVCFGEDFPHSTPNNGMNKAIAKR